MNLIYPPQMKKVLFVLFCFCSTISFAQKKLTDSRTGSYYTYIYKVSNQNVLKLYNNADYRLDDEALVQPVDSFKTGKRYNEDKLPTGNYLKVYADKNTLQYKLIERRTAFIHVLKNSDETQFAIIDREGNVVKTAQVSSNNKFFLPDTR